VEGTVGNEPPARECPIMAWGEASLHSGEREPPEWASFSPTVVTQVDNAIRHVCHASQGGGFHGP
jgi:hypothetical protein